MRRRTQRDAGCAVGALGGLGKDDAANLSLVVDQVRDVPDTHLGAHFACAMAIALPGGEDRVVEGRVDGSLVREPRGDGGFGYDPIFLPEGSGRTTAQMSSAEKHAISHRGRAFRALAPVIHDLLVAHPAS